MYALKKKIYIYIYILLGRLVVCIIRKFQRKSTHDVVEKVIYCVAKNSVIIKYKCYD